jgi:DNA-binding CsgD family transcriptional regulator/PAS domain-containing protein
MTHSAPPEAQINHLLQTLYESALNSAVREVFLQGLCDLLGVSPPLRSVITFDQAAFDICHNSPTLFPAPPQAPTHHTTPHWATPPPWRTTHERATGSRFDAPLDAWLSAPPEVHGVMTFMERHRDQRCRFGFFYRPSSPTFPAWQQQLFDALTPYCQAIAHFMRVTRRLMFPRHTFSATLAHAPYGALILNRAGKPIECNLTAQRILEQRSHLAWGSDGHVAAPHPIDTRRLQHQLERALTPPRAAHPKPPQLLKLPQASNALSCLEALAWPLPAHSDHNLPDDACALLLIHDPEAVPCSPHATLRQRFSLTDPEAHIGVGLTKGMSLSEIAWSLRMTEATVRRGLLNLRFKLGAPPRADLAATLLHALSTDQAV